jgi:hypothetical protein
MPPVVAAAVVRQLDPLLPALLQRCSGAELKQVVLEKLEARTGDRWAADDLGPLFAPTTRAGPIASRLR